MNTTASQTKACSELCWAAFRTAWGWAAAARSPRGVVRFVLPQPTRREVEAQLGLPAHLRADDAFQRLVEQTRAYFEGEPVAFEDPVDLGGLPPFTTRVLRAIRSIPYGSTATYGEVAARAGRPHGARGVGKAMVRNPVPLLCPCHRVVGVRGLGGFTAPGGLELKRRLLALEAGAAARG